MKAVLDQPTVARIQELVRLTESTEIDLRDKAAFARMDAAAEELQVLLRSLIECNAPLRRLIALTSRQQVLNAWRAVTGRDSGAFWMALAAQTQSFDTGPGEMNPVKET